jgi:hypothetical protein
MYVHVYNITTATVADTYTEQRADHSGNDIEFNKFKEGKKTIRSVVAPGRRGRR